MRRLCIQSDDRSNYYAHSDGLVGCLGYMTRRILMIIFMPMRSNTDRTEQHNGDVVTRTDRNIEMDHSLAYIRIGYVVVNILLELCARLRRSWQIPNFLS